MFFSNLMRIFAQIPWIIKFFFTYYHTFFNDLPIKREPSQKHLGLFRDEKLNFLEHNDEVIKNVTESINLLLSICYPYVTH